MYNSLCINNLLIIENIGENKQFIGKFINYQGNDYILYIYESFYNITDKNFISQRITFNDNRFAVTNIYINENKLFYNSTSKEFNNLIDKGILLLPFNSENYFNNSYSDNLYEYLLQQYSSFLNIFSNFDLLNIEKEKILIKYPISFCCNFENNYLDFVTKCIIENDNYDSIKLYHIIILKQIICCLYNGGIFDEEKIKDIFPFFYNFISKNIKGERKKLFNKILKEIIIITSYLKKYTIVDIKDIKFIFDNNYNEINFKSKLLLIELLLEQKKTQKEKELYDIIIQFEKNYLLNTFKKEDINSFDLSYYSSLKK